MARYGFGLLLPDMRAGLRLSDASIGVTAAAGYAAYLVVSLRTGSLVARCGPRAIVLAGGGCAVAGMLLAAAARGAPALAVAVAVAGASSALVFPPFADAIAAVVPEPGRARALAWTSSGTGAGVAVAAPLALIAGDWRLSWVLFAVAGVLTTLLAARVVPAAPLPPRDGRGHGDRDVAIGATPAGAGPLLASAVLVGLGAAVFWTWAVDRVASAGDLGQGTAQALLAVVGVASLGGALAADLVGRVGMRVGAVACGALLATALVALALAPGVIFAGVVAAVLFGTAYNILVTIQGLWSTRIFGRPARGLAAVMSAMGVGFLVGPLIAAPLDQRAAFLIAAALLAAAGVLGLTAPRSRGGDPERSGTSRASLADGPRAGATDQARRRGAPNTLLTRLRTVLGDGVPYGRSELTANARKSRA
jgi:predicted MFS family arabinose efflux permease